MSTTAQLGSTRLRRVEFGVSPNSRRASILARSDSAARVFCATQKTTRGTRVPPMDCLPVLLILLACLVGSLQAQDSVRTLAGLPETPGSADGTNITARFKDPAGIAIAATKMVPSAAMAIPAGSLKRAVMFVPSAEPGVSGRPASVRTESWAGRDPTRPASRIKSTGRQCMGGTRVPRVVFCVPQKTRAAESERARMLARREFGETPNSTGRRRVLPSCAVVLTLLVLVWFSCLGGRGGRCSGAQVALLVRP